MAKIDIFPLSIDGVKIPINFLDNILARNDTNNLLYPLDLVNNPIYGHAIQFTIYDYKYDKLETSFGSVQGGVSNFYKNSFSQGKLSVSKVIENAKNIKPEDLSVLEDFLVPANYVPKRDRTLANISLYLPDTLATSFDSDYTSVSLTETFSLAGVLTTGHQAYKSSLDSIKKNDAFNAAAIKGATSALLDGVTKGLAGNVLKTVLNPQLQLIYRGIGLREFQFEFIFTPTSKKEAEAVEKIIDSFMFYSLPETAMNGQFLIPPQIFGIKFVYTGGDGLANTITDVFKKTMTNVLGSQLSGWLSGGNPTNKMSKNQNTKLFDIGDCVLSNVNVDYAPNGWSSYQDGQPVQTRLTLQFKEMNIRSKSDMVGFKNSPYYNGDGGPVGTLGSIDDTFKKYSPFKNPFDQK